MAKRGMTIDETRSTSGFMNVVNLDIQNVIVLDKQIYEVYQAIGDDFIIVSEEDIYALPKKFLDQPIKENMISLKNCNFVNLNVIDDCVYIFDGSKIYCYNSDYDHYATIRIVNHEDGDYHNYGPDFYSIKPRGNVARFYHKNEFIMVVPIGTDINSINKNFILLENRIDSFSRDYTFIVKDTLKIHQSIRCRHIRQISDTEYLLRKDEICYLLVTTTGSITLMMDVNGSFTSGRDFYLIENSERRKLTLYRKNDMLGYNVRPVGFKYEGQISSSISRNDKYILIIDNETYDEHRFCVGKINESSASMAFEEEEQEEDEDMMHLIQRMRNM